MDLGLGVDTGGTFTDAAIVDLASGEVLVKAKAPTTYQDLSVGIMGAIDNAVVKNGIRPGDIKMVGLSTTLATNSILQGRGGEVALIGIGWTPDPDWHFGCRTAHFVKGGYDSNGRMLAPLDEKEVEAVLDDVCTEVDAVVVSGMFSVANPLQESTVRSMVTAKCQLPVVVGYDMTAELGIYERTVTAVLNAKLIPIIRDFLSSVETSLRTRGIDAPIYVFKGDGGLMGLEVAKQRPVDTLLSGPAASLMGGRALAGLDSCLVVDMGGTSTDIAYLNEGFPRLNKEGAMVGHWRTRVRAIDIWTIGLGGDSSIGMDDKGNLQIGPHRVAPLCTVARSFPAIKERMEAAQTPIFFLPIREPTPALSAKERKVLVFVRDHAPCTLYEAINGIDDVVFVEDQLESLKRRGYVQQTGLTPTDVMHVKGIYTAGDVDAARTALKVFSTKFGAEPDRLADMIMEQMVTRVGEEIIKKAITDGGGDVPDSKGFDMLVSAAAGAGPLQDVSITARPKVAIVGVGAPAHIFIKPLESRMDCQVVVPKDHDVGNAVGAVMSQVSETVTARIYPKDYKYMVFSPGSSPMEYSTIESAMAAAKSYTEYYVRDRIKLTGVVDVKVRVDEHIERFCDGYGPEMRFTNWVDITATATGKPRLRK
jgi:N-methylhydantoinase A/oxoprolinase/acetone carboxylase beta subunit